MPFFTKNSILRVESATDLVALVESYGIKLTRRGANYVGVCPFHREKTPSFNVNPAGQYFKCFGCGAAGGAIKFVELIDKAEFVEAVQTLAQRGGVELEYEKTAGRQNSAAFSLGKDAKTALLWANQTALKYFRESLAGSPAEKYLRDRGFTTDTLNAWQLGWSPDSYDGLVNYFKAQLRARGKDDKIAKALQTAVEAGALRLHAEQQRVYDAFRGRVMFPIFDLRQRPIGFGGRVLVEKPEAGGKYLNTSETPLFKKSQILFGLAFAAREIADRREAIIVEGYTDTIMCHQFGIRNVVATLGTALTPEHVKLLRRHCGADGKIIALFDADSAGQKATARAVEIFMSEDTPLWVLQNLAVKDAAEFLPKFGELKFREFLSGAQESFAHALQSTLAQNFGGDYIARDHAVRKMMALVNLCPNAMKREMMRQQVAEISGVNIELLPQPKPASREAPSAENFGSSPAFAGAGAIVLEPKRAGRQRLEKTLLRCMAVEQTWCAKIADAYPPDDWQFYELAEAARLIRDTWETARPEIIRLQQETLDDQTRAALLSLLDDAPSPTEATLNEILARLEKERRAKNSAKIKARLREQLATAELQGDAAAVEKLLDQISRISREPQSASTASTEAADH